MSQGLCVYLHGGAVGFAADECGGDVCVCVLVFQVHHIRHAARQEKLVTLHLTTLEQDSIDVPSWRAQQHTEQKTVSLNQIDVNMYHFYFDLLFMYFLTFEKVHFVFI